MSSSDVLDRLLARHGTDVRRRGRLGDNLDLTRVQAGYPGAVLRLRVPVAEQAKPRKIQIRSGAAAGRASIGA